MQCSTHANTHLLAQPLRLPGPLLPRSLLQRTPRPPQRPLVVPSVPISRRRLFFQAPQRAGGLLFGGLPAAGVDDGAQQLFEIAVARLLGAMGSV